MSNIDQCCSRCVLDTTVPEITFDENGECQYCKIHDLLEKTYPNGEAGKVKIEELVRKIKKAGRKKKYDCLVGVSGGQGVPEIGVCFQSGKERMTVQKIGEVATEEV